MPHHALTPLASKKGLFSGRTSAFSSSKVTAKSEPAQAGSPWARPCELYAASPARRKPSRKPTGSDLWILTSEAGHHCNERCSCCMRQGEHIWECNMAPFGVAGSESEVSGLLLSLVVL